MVIILVFWPFYVQQKDYLEYSQHQTLLVWFLWIDLLKVQQVHLAALKYLSDSGIAAYLYLLCSSCGALPGSLCLIFSGSFVY
jgi:hypothetical protein